MKIDKSQIVALSYLLWCVIGYAFAVSSPVWDSLYFIREHGFVIALLFLIKNKSITTFSYLLKYGIIFYKFALIIYNIVLMFYDYSEYNKLKGTYEYIMLFAGIIFLSIVISKFFNQIINIYYKIKQSIYYKVIINILISLMLLALLCYLLIYFYNLIMPYANG